MHNRIALCLLILCSLGQTREMADTTRLSSPRLSQRQARRLLLQSAILPGWGERSLHYTRRANVLHSTEAVGWLTWGFFTLRGQALRQAMSSYAVAHAGINPHHKDANYFADIGNYRNIYEYNEQKLRNRQVQLVYPLTTEFFWAWDSDAARREFDKQRVLSATALHNAGFALGGLILNRIVSMLDIIILTRGQIESPVPKLSSTWHAHPNGVTYSLQVNF